MRGHRQPEGPNAYSAPTTACENHDIHPARKLWEPSQRVLDPQVPAAGLRIADPNSAYTIAVKIVTTPLSANASISDGPVAPAAMPVSTKMPAPIIAPTPIIVMSNSDRLRDSSVECASMTGRPWPPSVPIVVVVADPVHATQLAPRPPEEAGKGDRGAANPNTTSPPTCTPGLARRSLIVPGVYLYDVRYGPRWFSLDA